MKIPPDLIYPMSSKVVYTTSLKRKSPQRLPKRASLEPFQVFCTEKREQLNRENPQLNPSEITSLLSQMWRSMDVEQKTVYVSITKKYNEHYTDLSLDLLDNKPSQTMTHGICACPMGVGEIPMFVSRLGPPIGVGVVPRGTVGHSAALASSRLYHILR